HALAYARRGWAVFPVAPHQKNPLVAEGFKEATTDEDQIVAWWTQWPTANIGLATGSINGIAIIDVDIRNGGAESVGQLAGQVAGLYDTLIANTGGGGWHLYYTYPEDGEVRCRNGRVAPGIDIKGDGGYVLAPPSIHPNGRSYEWPKEGAS